LGLNPGFGFLLAQGPEQVMVDQDLIREVGLPEAHQFLVFLGGQAGFAGELLVEEVEAFLEGPFLFFAKGLPGVAQFDRFAGITQLQEMALDRVAVDLQGGGGLQDVAVVNDEPMEEIMLFQILGEKAPAP